MLVFRLAQIKNLLRHVKTAPDSRQLELQRLRHVKTAPDSRQLELQLDIFFTNDLTNATLLAKVKKRYLLLSLFFSVTVLL
jgi:hypothetical protein